MIREIGSTAGIGGEAVALSRILGVGRNGEQRAREVYPGGAIVRFANNRAREIARGAARIVTRCKNALAVLLQLPKVEIAGLPVFLKIGFLAFGISGHTAMQKGLLLSRREARHQHDEQHHERAQDQ